MVFCQPLFTFHTGQMETHPQGYKPKSGHHVHIPHRSDGDGGVEFPKVVPRGFTFHTGQMETLLDEFAYSLLNKFTFHTGQMETQISAVYCLLYGVFTFHTGQMETWYELSKAHPEEIVHIPHRSDGDLCGL